MELQLRMWDRGSNTGLFAKLIWANWLKLMKLAVHLYNDGAVWFNSVVIVVVSLLSFGFFVLRALKIYNLDHFSLLPELLTGLFSLFITSIRGELPIASELMSDSRPREQRPSIALVATTRSLYQSFVFCAKKPLLWQLSPCPYEEPPQGCAVSPSVDHSG